MRKLFKGLKILLGVLTGLSVLVVAAVYVLSSIRVNRKHPIPPIPVLALASDSLTLTRGKHLVTSVANCTFCHGADLGGMVLTDDALGVIVGANLTRRRGGIGPDFTEEDWVRAIRHGVRRDGTSLLVMPSEAFVHMSLPDLAAIISYLKALPPVNRQLPESKLRFVGRSLFATGKTSLLVAEKTAHRTTPVVRTPVDTLAYGRYLADMSGCRGCHGLNLSGGRVAGPPGTPLTSNLTSAGPIGRWTEAQFRRALRTGKRPNGTLIDEFMPWRVSGQMTDEELHAIWVYLRSVPPLAFGNR
jgi:mono/diheme cytochrome c family protein